MSVTSDGTSGLCERVDELLRRVEGQVRFLTALRGAVGALSDGLLRRIVDELDGTLAMGVFDRPPGAADAGAPPARRESDGQSQPVQKQPETREVPQQTGAPAPASSSETAGRVMPQCDDYAPAVERIENWLRANGPHIATEIAHGVGYSAAHVYTQMNKDPRFLCTTKICERGRPLKLWGLTGQLVPEKLPPRRSDPPAAPSDSDVIEHLAAIRRSGLGWKEKLPAYLSRDPEYAPNATYVGTLPDGRTVWIDGAETFAFEAADL